MKRIREKKEKNKEGKEKNKIWKGRE